MIIMGKVTLPSNIKIKKFKQKEKLIRISSYVTRRYEEYSVNWWVYF
jgi:hypothetical protein